MSGLKDLASFFVEEAPRLRRFLRRFGPSVSPEDIAQDSFAHLLAAGLENVESPRAYLFRTARNLALNQKKRAGLVEFELVGDPSMLNHAAETPDPEQQAIACDMLARLSCALSALPQRQRLALLLFKLEGRSYKEIGVVLGVSHRSVERYVAEALTHCHAVLGEDFGPDAS